MSILQNLWNNLNTNIRKVFSNNTPEIETSSSNITINFGKGFTLTSSKCDCVSNVSLRH